MSTFVRGATIFFDATTTDQRGSPAAPNSAVLTLIYQDTKHNWKTVLITMTIAGNVSSAQWDSAVSLPGTVNWSIKAIGSTLTIKKDGSLTLTAGPAN